MSEPPEPRRPEEDGGEEPEDLNAYEGEMDGVDRDAAREFVQDSTPDMQDAIDAARERYGDEQFDAMVEEVLRRANERGEDDFLGEAEDDMLLDELGGSGDLPLGENSELSDMLGAWRDDVESEPVPPIAEHVPERPPKRKRRPPRTRSPLHGMRVNLTRLLPDYLAHPEGFARPGPPPSDPLPLKFTCQKCSKENYPSAIRCRHCGESFILPNAGGT